MELTNSHAKVIAGAQSKRCASGSVRELTSVLTDAQADLDSHPVEATLRGLWNPFSRAAMWAGEDGPAKSAEPKLLRAQKWMERMRQPLVVLAVNLRKQLSQAPIAGLYLPLVNLENCSINREGAHHA